MKYDHASLEIKRQALAQGFKPKGRRLTLIERLQQTAGKRSKFGNIKTTINGEIFDSRHEAVVVIGLRASHGEENIIRQISLPINEQRIRPDVLRIIKRYDDGTFRAELIDAKGSPATVTEEYKAKANCLKALHDLAIRLIFKR